MGIILRPANLLSLQNIYPPIQHFYFICRMLPVLLNGRFAQATPVSATCFHFFDGDALMILIFVSSF